jgi:hypothetical protein
MSIRIRKSNICILGMVVGIGLIGLLPVLHNLDLFGYRLF